MFKKIRFTFICLALFSFNFALAGDEAKVIASAESAGPPSVTADATIKDAEGNVLREGTNQYTCYPEQEAMGPMCNDSEWDALISAVMSQSEYSPKALSISYMLAGEGAAPGTSNSNPYATKEESDDWVVEGPHLMIIVPNKAMLEGISRDPADAVYVMWGDTDYAHIMVKTAE